MKRILRKTGRFYSGMMMQNIGIFIFIGLLSVLFGENGWLPDENIYALSQFVYSSILPVFIAYMGGSRLSGQTGGVLSLLMAAGCVAADPQAGILSGMLSAPVGGVCWKYIGEPLRRRTKPGIQMLTGNLLSAFLGSVLAIAGYGAAAPVFAWISGGLSYGVNFLIEHGLLAVVSIAAEPVKVLFLNNILNHGVLVPLGMEQLAHGGNSVLFLVESNPGPGLGVLAALYCCVKEKRPAYAAAITAQAVGGLHEVYFPEVLANLRLLAPLSLAGAAGTFWFERMGCGLQGAVSPGSVVTILLMAGKTAGIKVLAGIMLSAAVSFAGSMLILRGKVRADAETKGTACGTKKQAQDAKTYKEEELHMVRKIGFVCDAGVGSSAMGAALFRRRLIQKGITGVTAEAYASDAVPEDLDMIVCQRDFLRLLGEGQKETQIFPVESLLGGEEFERLLELILERNG